MRNIRDHGSLYRCPFNDGEERRRNDARQWISLQNPGPTLGGKRTNLPIVTAISIEDSSLPSFRALGLMQVMPDVLLPICI